jgi:hypothetical protein
MAGVRDPAFWKRFSTAVHKREEVVVDPEKNETAYVSLLPASTINPPLRPSLPILPF